MKIETHEDLTRKEPEQKASDRSFGLVLGIFLALLGIWPLLRHGAPRIWVLGAAGIFLLLALVRPSLLHPLNRLWIRVGLLLSKVTNPVIMGLLFYLVITPFAAFFRLMGKDSLRLKFDPESASYWIPRHPPGPPPETMRNQF